MNRSSIRLTTVAYFLLPVSCAAAQLFRSGGDGAPQAAARQDIDASYQAPIEIYGGKRISAEDLGIVPEESLEVAGQRINPRKPPRGFRFEQDLGVMVADGLSAKRLHAFPRPHGFCEPVRAIKTPGGDFLAMMPCGTGHMIRAEAKRNELIAYRSSDKGKTWSKPFRPWQVPYNQHGFNPLIPRGAKRIYAFGTEPTWELFVPPHDGGIGMRYSDDDGRTWSQVKIIRPTNDPSYIGVGHMQGCETDKGTWLIGTYSVRYRTDRGTRVEDGTMPNRTDHQYVLRSEDQGKTWELIPGPRPRGWTIEPWRRALEGRIISLGGSRALMQVRVPSGNLWETRSDDDGRTWTELKPTDLIHPDAPPMLFKLSDGKTLIIFIHNSPSLGWRDGKRDRGELWVTLSRDDGKTWSEPRLLMVDVSKQAGYSDHGITEVSYADLIVDGSTLHLFLDHQKRQILYFTFDESLVGKLPTKQQFADL